MGSDVRDRGGYCIKGRVSLRWSRAAGGGGMSMAHCLWVSRGA